MCSAVIAGGRAAACSGVACLCSAGISEVSGLRVGVIVWGMPAAASSAASSFEAAAAAAVAGDISAFLPAICSNQSCSSASAAAAAGEFLVMGSSTRGGRGEESNSCLGGRWVHCLFGCWLMGWLLMSGRLARFRIGVDWSSRLSRFWRGDLLVLGSDFRWPLGCLLWCCLLVLSRCFGG